MARRRARLCTAVLGASAALTVPAIAASPAARADVPTCQTSAGASYLEGPYTGYFAGSASASLAPGSSPVSLRVGDGLFVRFRGGALPSVTGGTLTADCQAKGLVVYSAVRPGRSVIAETVSGVRRAITVTVATLPRLSRGGAACRRTAHGLPTLRLATSVPYTAKVLVPAGHLVAAIGPGHDSRPVDDGSPLLTPACVASATATRKSLTVFRAQHPGTVQVRSIAVGSPAQEFAGGTVTIILP